jgi:hypothetical protein
MTTDVLDVRKLDIKYDAVRLKQELELLYRQYPFHKDANQIALSHSGKFTTIKEQMYDGVGSLYDRENGVASDLEENYTVISDYVKGRYWEDVIKSVQNVSSFPLGRIRLMLLKPKTCYSWHRDSDEIRYHIPIATNANCFIGTEQGLYRMEEEGRLYTLISTRYHTALNASFKPRVHLVFSTYTS